MSNRIVTVTANYLNRTPPEGYEFADPQPHIKGKFFYLWHDDHLVKHRFLGYCLNQYAFRIVTLKEDCWSKLPKPTSSRGEK